MTFPFLKWDSVSLEAKSSWLLRDGDKEMILHVAKFLVALVKSRCNSGRKPYAPLLVRDTLVMKIVIKKIIPTSQLEEQRQNRLLKNVQWLS